MRFASLLAVLVVATTDPAFSQTALASVADRVWGAPLTLPAQVNILSLTPGNPTTRQTYVLQRTYAADGSFSEDWKSDQGLSHQEFRANGTLVTSVTTDPTEGSVTETTDAQRTTVHTTVTVKGAVQSDRRVDLKAGVVLRTELPHLVVQAWRAGIRDGLKLQSLSPDGGMVGDFLIVFRQTDDPTSVSSLYQYPGEFRAALPPGRPYLVADMSLQGVGAFFFPHHFYLIYEPTPTGLVWQGYFGQDPKKPIFQFKKS